MSVSTEEAEQKQWNRRYRVSHHEKVLAINQQYRRTHKASMNERRRNHMKELKDKVYAVLGKKCTRCGFDDWRALQIDHINGNGESERKKFGGNSAKFFLGILEHPENYQILCANCNWIKRYENNERPYPPSGFVRGKKP